jgi:predicted transcriptional regulator
MNQQKFEKLYAPKRERVEQLIKFLKERHRPIYSIQSHFNIDRTTVRNYIRTLRDLEVGLQQDELKKYYI